MVWKRVKIGRKLKRSRHGSDPLLSLSYCGRRRQSMRKRVGISQRFLLYFIPTSNTDPYFMSVSNKTVRSHKSWIIFCSSRLGLSGGFESICAGSVTVLLDRQWELCVFFYSFLFFATPSEVDYIRTEQKRACHCGEEDVSCGWILWRKMVKRF